MTSGVLNDYPERRCVLIRSCMVLLGILSAGAMWHCQSSEPASPAHPRGVPTGARWIGGADGGMFLRCSCVDARIRCEMWHDYTGELTCVAEFAADESGCAAQSLVQAATFVDAYNGRIRTTDGRLWPGVPKFGCSCVDDDANPTDC